MKPADVAAADQARAATDHAERALWRHVRGLPGGGTARVGVTTPPWLAVKVRRHLATIAAGEGLGCVHIVGSPVLTVMALWRPGVVLCTRCATRDGNPLLSMDATEDARCDACEGDYPDGLRVSVTQLAGGLLYFALCTACLTRWVGDT